MENTPRISTEFQLVPGPPDPGNRHRHDLFPGPVFDPGIDRCEAVDFGPGRDRIGGRFGGPGDPPGRRFRGLFTGCAPGPSIPAPWPNLRPGRASTTKSRTFSFPETRSQRRGQAPESHRRRATGRPWGAENAAPVVRWAVLPTFADPRSARFMPLHPSAGAEVDTFADLSDLFGDVHPYREKVDRQWVCMEEPPIERV
jgi:hypothetical protein